MTRRTWFSIRLQTILCCALIAAQPVFGQSRNPPNPTPGRDGGGQRDGGNSNWAPWAIAVGIAGAIAVASQARQNKALVNDENLLKDGPRFPDSFHDGVFAVQGYVGGSWPFVVDFLPKPHTCTHFELSVDEKIVFSRIIDWDGLRGRQLVTLVLPPRADTKPAMYVIRSTRPACAEVRLNETGIAVPIEVYGIGAGRRAVGSVAIDNLRFAPTRPRFPGDRVTMAYEAKSDFNRASVEILRYDRPSPGVIDVVRVKAEPVKSVNRGENRAEPWDGTLNGGVRSVGVHRLQVRGWYTEDDRSWVGAISKNSVVVE